MLTLGGGAGAATWEFTPSATASTEYTDNVRGVNSGAESDLILTATPGFNLRGTGARLQLNLNASVAYEEYLDTKKLGGYSPTLTGAANAELLENHLFLDASTSYRRSTINRNRAISASQRDLGSNQTDTFNIRLSPVARFRVGQWVQSETRLTATQTLYDPLGENDDPAATNTSDATTLSLTQRLSSGRYFQRFGWSLLASETRTKRESGTANTSSGDTFTRRNAEAQVQYFYDRWFSPNARVGIDRTDDNSLRDDEFDGPYWFVGFSSQPGPRTSLSLSAGRRFGGPSYNGSLTYRISSAINLRASYSETVTTQQERVSDPFEFVGTDEFGNLIDTRTGLPIDPSDPAFDQTFADAVFRSRTLNAGLTGSRLRNTYSVQMFYSRRDTSGVNPRESKSTGVTATFTRQLSPQLSVGLNGSINGTTDNANADSQSFRVGTTVNYRLSDTMTTSLSLRHFERRTAGGSGDNDLSENSLIVTVRKTF